MGRQVVLALNMSDMADARGTLIEQTFDFLGTPAVRVSTTEKRGLDDLLSAIVVASNREKTARPLVNLGQKVEPLVQEIERDMRQYGGITSSARWSSLMLIEGLIEPGDLVKDKEIAERIHASLRKVDREDIEWHRGPEVRKISRFLLASTVGRGRVPVR